MTQSVTVKCISASYAPIENNKIGCHAQFKLEREIENETPSPTDVFSIVFPVQGPDVTIFPDKLYTLYLEEVVDT